jgi:Tol biopolymer transport system component
MEGERVPKPLLKEKYTEANPQISPDGRWMAYLSGESGGAEVYVCPFPDVNKGKWQVSTNGGLEPRWSRDGREVFYRNGDAMMAVAVETAPTFRVAGIPKELFRGNYFSQYGHQWDLSRDGKRFLMIKEPEAAASTGSGPRKINIVVNWFEELKRLAPVK